MNTPANNPFNLIHRDFFSQQISHVVGIFLYTTALIFILKDYASVEWKIYRFDYIPMGLIEYFSLAIYLALTGYAVPRRIQSPSSLILIFVLILVVIPAGICLMAMEIAGTPKSFETLAAIGLSFAGACLLNRNAASSLNEARRLPHRALVPAMVLVNATLLIYLIYRFGDIMSFASLDSLYEQRQKGSADNFIDGYAQAYSQYVLSTGLIAFGLYRKNIPLILFGFTGSIINFMITAEKSGFLYPFFICALYFIVKSSHGFFKSAAFIMIFISGLLFFSIKMYTQNSIAEFIAWYVGIRTTMSTGSFIVQYMEFFSSRGFTYFSHIRGIGEFIATPSQYANDARWPALGVIIGEDHFGFSRLNANANFIASDGIASLGIAGIPVIFFIFSLYLKILDKSAQGIGSISLVLLLPFALTLSNGSLFTLMTSFGGIFWVIIMNNTFVKRKL